MSLHRLSRIDDGQSVNRIFQWFFTCWKLVQSLVLSKQDWRNGFGPCLALLPCRILTTPALQHIVLLVDYFILPYCKHAEQNDPVHVSLHFLTWADEKPVPLRSLFHSKNCDQPAVSPGIAILTHRRSRSRSLSLMNRYQSISTRRLQRGGISRACTHVLSASSFIRFLLDYTSTSPNLIVV